MNETIIKRCEDKGLRMTEQRRVIAKVLEGADDHPDVEELYVRASALDSAISIATMYRTVKLFEEAGILEKHESMLDEKNKKIYQLLSKSIISTYKNEL